MKNKISLSIIIALLLFSACSKNAQNLPNPTDPHPGNPVKKGIFKLIFEDIPTFPMADNLTATLTIQSGKTPFTSYTISTPIVYDQKYKTGQVDLPVGFYSIKKMIVKDNNHIAKFAAPIAGSAKANLVQSPLDIQLKLEGETEKTQPVQVLPVKNSDNPLLFGYPEGSFGIRSEMPDSEMDIPMQIRAMVRVGDVVYDSIPAQLIVKSWDAKNNMNYQIHYLQAGTQSILLPAKAVKYNFSLSKWGSSDEFTLNKDQIEQHTIYDIGGDVAAKKLKSVYEFKIVNELSTPVTKSDYEYHENGKVKLKQVWGKRADLSTYLVKKDVYEYANTRITAIASYNQDNVLIKKTSVQYHPTKGRVQLLEEMSENQRTKISADYVVLNSRTGITQDYRIDIQYDFEQRQPNEQHSKNMHGGVVLSDVITNSVGKLEQGFYSFDFGINPFIHLNIPERDFSQYQRHNLKHQWKTWLGGYPLEEAYAFTYTYDGDGYPKELHTKFRSYSTKKDTYTLRTVYTYY